MGMSLPYASRGVVYAPSTIVVGPPFATGAPVAAPPVDPPPPQADSPSIRTSASGIQACLRIIKKPPGNCRLSAAEEWRNGGNYGVLFRLVAVCSASSCGKRRLVVHLFCTKAQSRFAGG